MVAALLQARADIDARCPYTGALALHLAAAGGHTAVLSLLLGAGACLEATDSQGRSALMWAAVVGQEGSARALVTAGAELGGRDSGGQTALLLHCCSLSPCPGLVLLLSCPASVSQACRRGRTPLLELLRCPASHRLPALLALVRAGADLSSPPSLPSPLHLALSARDLPSASLLIRAGAPLQEESVILALRSGLLEAASLMVAGGASLPSPHPSLGEEGEAWVRGQAREVASLREAARVALRRALGGRVWSWVGGQEVPRHLATYVALLLD